MIFLFMLKEEKEKKKKRIKTSNAIVVLKINNGKLDLERGLSWGMSREIVSILA